MLNPGGRNTRFRRKRNVESTSCRKRRKKKWIPRSLACRNSNSPLIAPVLTKRSLLLISDVSPSVGKKARLYPLENSRARLNHTRFFTVSRRERRWDIISSDVDYSRAAGGRRTTHSWDTSRARSTKGAPTTARALVWKSLARERWGREGKRPVVDTRTAPRIRT